MTDDVWAEAAGETEESLRRVIDAGASAKQALGETTGSLQDYKYINTTCSLECIIRLSS